MKGNDLEFNEIFFINLCIKTNSQKIGKVEF